ncbi:Hpt domain-containing protein [Salinimonas sp. HHU 13199]|uniref:Hpt domain-containing protein n=1 Tax=Salinimonas profundi TaxID=2729140 RepID=A0ABR8LLL5_9ALTE|nr:Hpt domain-containing protein [Salinimonas profundi]MBD3585237.1 Hpt domain-containing protein [Salinimonas profundi]
MNNTTSVIDLAFGVSQLSGNRNLYVSLLQKFAAEYQDLPVRLDHALAENRWHDVRTMVHTVKGVAGNLGCNALHAEARVYEDAIRDSHTVPASHHSFIDVLSETLRAIDKLASDSGETHTVNISQARQDFLNALNHHEFISDETLTQWMDTLAMPADKQSAIREAIDELDYDIAIAIVKAHSV